MLRKLICTLLIASFCCLMIATETVQAKGDAGSFLAGCIFASCCLGPRNGREINEKKTRTIELLRPVPVVNHYAWTAVGMEAYGGKTMTEISQVENLSK